VDKETLVQLVKKQHTKNILAISIIHDHVHGPNTMKDRQKLVETLGEAGIAWVIFGGDHEPGTLEKVGDVGVHWGLGDFVFGCDCSGASRAKAITVEISGGGSLAKDHEVVPGYAGNNYRAAINVTPPPPLDAVPAPPAPGSGPQPAVH
jgi:hypothetical protein